MKKAFDANVSRAKPRVRLGALMTQNVEETVAAPAVEAIAEQVAREAFVATHEAPVIPSADLSSALKSRAAARANRPTAAEALQEALGASNEPELEVPVAKVTEVVAKKAVVAEPVVHVEAPAKPVEAKVVVEAPKKLAPVMHAEPPATVVEVQTAPAPVVEEPQVDTGERRERLKERLRAVRENPRPEPLPDTVAEAGVLAVERIATLQTELAKARAMNLALAQDLEAARRQAERATEEARLRMDEARRLSNEMESRVKLLSELERELESLEGERNEALLALQESRALLELREKEKLELNEALTKKDAEIDECLAEEERLAAELETAQETNASLRRSTDVLKSERDTLARQVSELTRERAELLEARKALEAVHRALSSAVVR